MTSGGIILDPDDDHCVVFRVDDVDVDGACCVSNDGPGGLERWGIVDLAPKAFGSGLESEIFPAAMASSW